MPRKNKSKEELVDDIQKKQEVARKRTLIVDQFYPALIEATISVDESKALIQAMSTLLMEEVLRTMRERKFSEISESLLKVLCTDGEREIEIKKLLGTLESETLFTAREIIEGMTNAIEVMIREEMQTRKLDTLKADWNRYLNV